MNIRGSKRCAKPVRPGTSSFEPTWYQRSTATSGLDRSVWRITRSPLASAYVSNSILSIGAGTSAGIMARIDARLASKARLSEGRLDGWAAGRRHRFGRRFVRGALVALGLGDRSREQRHSRIAGDLAASRQAAGDRPGHDIWPHPVGRRRPELGLDLRAARDLDGQRLYRRRTAGRSVLCALAGHGALLFG